MGLPHPCLMLTTEPRDGLATVVGHAVDGGVDVVLWREGRAKIGKRDPVFTGLAAVTDERALLIAGGDWETFVRLGIRRIHLAERSVPVGVVKFRIGNGALVGKSVGSVASAVQAEATGADYVIVGEGAGQQDEADRLDLLREVCSAVRVSVIAAGDITPENALDCVLAGAAGVAVSASVLQAPDPLAAAAKFREALDTAWAAKDRG